MSIIKAVISGIIGAVVLTVIHQVARRRLDETCTASERAAAASVAGP